MNTKEDFMICTRCVMDTSDPLIRFDSSGVWNHCTEYFNKSEIYTYQGQKTDLAFSSPVVKNREKVTYKMYDYVVKISRIVDSYKDYPNGEKMLNFTYKVYNTLKRALKR